MSTQTSLFDLVKEELPIVDGQLTYYPDWINEAEASSLFTHLREGLEWQQSLISLYGKQVKIPRLNAWYGDSHCSYEYSGTRFEANPWTASLLDIKARIERLTGFRFNSVLANCYRDGQDSVAWHSDDEPELGHNPIVASVSLGSERQFQLRHRYDKNLETQKLALAHGSLLVMSGELQHYWHHQIPKTRKNVDERINLTFRYVLPDNQRD